MKTQNTNFTLDKKPKLNESDQEQNLTANSDKEMLKNVMEWLYSYQADNDNLFEPITFKGTPDKNGFMPSITVLTSFTISKNKLNADVQSATGMSASSARADIKEKSGESNS